MSDARHTWTEPRACKGCGEYSLEPHQVSCPFCDGDTLPLSEIHVFRNPPMTPAFMLHGWAGSIWGPGGIYSTPPEALGRRAG